MTATMSLEQATATIELLSESLADVEQQLARDNQGWSNLTGWDVDGASLTTEGRRDAVRLARLMATMNPLIKNGLGIRAGYVWGSGVTITVRDDAHKGQDVGAVVEEFLNDPDVLETWSGAQAREESERALGTDGELFHALPTDPLTGHVTVRLIDPREITLIITDPHNKRRPWFYKREYLPVTINTQTGKPDANPKPVTEYYPALGYRPLRRQHSLGEHPILWDTPVHHTAVNRVGNDLRGVPDTLAALGWARLYKEFLEAWAVLMKALSRYAYRARGENARRTARALAATTDSAMNPQGAGATVINADLEAIPKTGATIDAESGRPLAMMVAAALGIPVTMILGDPGATGARAVAETLDQPTENGFWMRREIHRAGMAAILGHVIDSAIIAPAGSLRGTLRRQGDRLFADLPANDSRQVSIEFPDFDSTGVLDKVRAIQLTDGTDTLDKLTIARLLLQALKVPDVDEVLKLVTDDQGRWIPPEIRHDDMLGYALDRGGQVT